MTNMCPHCGFDLQVDQPIATPDFVWHPRLSCVVSKGPGANIRLTPSESIALGTLLKAGGGVVSFDVLVERLGAESNCEREYETVRVYMSRIRKKLRDLGGDAITSVWGRGYRWAGVVYD